MQWCGSLWFFLWHGGILLLAEMNFNVSSWLPWIVSDGRKWKSGDIAMTNPCPCSKCKGVGVLGSAGQQAQCNQWRSHSIELQTWFGGQAFCQAARVAF